MKKDKVKRPKKQKCLEKVKNKEKNSAFEEYIDRLPENDRAELSLFMRDVETHISLPRSWQVMLRRDYMRAFLYYASHGVSLLEAMNRLNPRKLGGFYARPPILWYPLDNAAKIYPLSMKHGQMAVFRLSIYLKKDVVPELLQMALNFTIKRFPSFATTVKKGFFWHYLDTSKRRYSTWEESNVPCRPLKISASGSQSFRVLYYQNRISVEYFHILTDGTGGMVFLKTLAAEYLRLLGADIKTGNGVLDINDLPRIEEAENEFLRADRAEKASGFVDKQVVQMSGRLSKIKPCKVLHFKMDANKLHELARSKDSTVTAYILSRMFVAGRHATDENSGDMSIQVPVNMRKFSPSETLRNFSLYCGIRFPISHITSADDILVKIKHQLDEKSSRKAMSEMLNGAVKLVSSVRYIPLFIKAPVAGAIYGFLGDKIFCNTLSNLGVVTFPDGMAEHVESMDFVLGTEITNRAACAMVTVGNVATLSISKLTADPSFEEALYDLLCQDGIVPVVEGSELYES